MGDSENGKKGIKGFFFHTGSGRCAYGPYNIGRVIGTVYGVGFATVLAAAAVFSGTFINRNTEKSLIITFGKVVRQVDDPGLKWKTPFISRRFAISTTRQTVEIDSNTKLRTGDDIRMTGGFDIEFRVRKNADIKKYYEDLRGYDGDVKSMVEARAMDATVRAVESMTIQDLVPPLDENGKPVSGKSFTELMTKRIAEKLQEVFDKGNWGIEVMGVYSKGFTFDETSEKKLAEIVGIRQEAVKLALRQKNAEKAKHVYEVEAEADARYLDGIRRSTGITDDNALAAIFCLKTARDAANLNEPFTPGCFSKSGLAIAIDPTKIPAHGYGENGTGTGSDTGAKRIAPAPSVK